MAARTPPCYKHPEWSESRYRTFIRSNLRAMTMRWQPAQEAWKLVQRKSQLEDKRVKFEYQCANCSGWFQKKLCENNHKTPTGVMMEGMDHSTIGDWVDRLLAPVEDYEILCKVCHLALSNEQNTERRENK